MRTDEERRIAMHRRAAEIEREGMIRKVRTIQASVFAAGLAATVCLAAVMSAAAGPVTQSGTLRSMNGSIFAGSGMLGYLVIGIIAFILGVSVTVFCYQVKKLKAITREDAAGDKEDFL